MKSNITVYPLQAKQTQFSNDLHVLRLFGGAKGGGKSYGMRSEAVKQCRSAKYVRGLVLRRSRPEVMNNFVLPMTSEFRRWFGRLPMMKHTGSSENRITFPTYGSTIDIGYCKNIKDVLQYQGVEYDFVCIEEITNREEEWFDIICTSLRTSRRGIIPNFFGSANPGGIGHTRVKRRWIDRQFQEGEDPEEYGYIPAVVYDNPILIQNDPKYLKRLLSLPEKLRKAYLEGDWDIFEGQYFGEFREDIHVIDPFYPIEGVKRRLIGLDYGYSAPSAVLWLAEMNNGDIIVYRELYVTKHTVKQLAEAIKSLMLPAERVEAIIYDPAIDKASEDTGDKLSDRLNITGLRKRPGDNHRIKGWNHMREMLQPHKDPNTTRIVSQLKITRNCSNLLRTLPALTHDERVVDDVNTKLEDHAPDALRYVLLEIDKRPIAFDQLVQLNDIILSKVQDIRGPEKSEKERGILIDRTTDILGFHNANF